MLRPGREVPYRGEVAMTVSSTAYALPTPDLVLDRYRPLRPLGRGGSGSVWLARDERTGLEVALKIVPREGKRASRAAREMEAASRLRHERCVRAYDFGGDSGHVYIAYEYVQGSTLRETLRSGKLGDRDAVEASAQILDALAHAHRIGIVHRDVKPSNVLVEVAPTISIRLLDFGLAQFDEADTLTAVGDVPGTLAYIAPERLRGGDATAASDVWAVGVLLWEALVGEHPFWGVPLPQVAAAIEAGAKPIGTARPDLPPAIADAVSSALTIDPSRRPSAEQLADALRTALTSPRRDRSKSARPRQATIAPRPAAAAIPLERQLIPAALAAGTVTFAAALLPFWTPGLVLAACSRGGRRDDQGAADRPRDRPLRADLPARQRSPGGRRRVRRVRRRLAGRVLARRAGGPALRGGARAGGGRSDRAPTARGAAGPRARSAGAPGVHRCACRRCRGRCPRQSAAPHRLDRAESRHRRQHPRHGRHSGRRDRRTGQHRPRRRRSCSRTRCCPAAGRPQAGPEGDRGAGGVPDRARRRSSPRSSHRSRSCLARAPSAAFSRRSRSGPVATLSRETASGT